MECASRDGKSCLGKCKCENVIKLKKGFEFLIQESNDVFKIISPDGIIKYTSPAIEKILGFRPEEVMGKSYLDFFQGEERIKLVGLMESAVNDADKTFRDNLCIKTRWGREICLEFSMHNYLEEPSIRGIVVNCRDITERIEKQRKLVYTATYDNLTRLPNRTNLMRQIEYECQQVRKNSTSFALLKLDIDGLKDINNILGFHYGDILIVKIAQRLKDLIGTEGSFYRISGDKFGIIVPGFNSFLEYKRLAEYIMDIFNEPFKLDEYELYITISMGVSICTDGGQDADTLMKQADLSLRKAKKEGKNKCEFFSSNFMMENYRHFTLGNDLLNAVDKGQLEVHYQPLIKLQTNEIIAAEALIRWRHPVLGMIPPNEFIPIAEENGFIIPLGKWILKEVCRNYKRWLEEGLPNIKVAINYSTLQFLEIDFVQNIIETIEEFNLDPHFLIIEITESIFMADFKQTKEKLNQLQEYGIQIALDDFGTGYSSLSYLNELDINILKIDRSFINNILLKNISSVITRMIIDTSEELKIKLVAEGIETEEQLETLRDLNCYTGQGFLYSKPIPKDDFARILRKRKCYPLQNLA